MGSIGRKDELPLRGRAQEEVRVRVARPDPRLGTAVAPWGMVRALAARCPVVLGGDYPLVLAGLQAVLGAEPGLRVAGAEEGTLAALRRAGLATSVLVLVSPRWTEAHEEALAGLRARAPGVRVVLLTDERDGEWLHRFRLDGGRAVLPVAASASDVVAAVLAARPALAADWGTPEAGLSEREALVLRHKVNGHANKTIAVGLGISVKTVETYYTRGMEKLGLKSRVAMLQYGVSRGWISGAG